MSIYSTTLSLNVKINLKTKLIAMLFKTSALKVADYDRPFWYTSGKIGPYYINTHFLYGGEKKANDLLDIINKEKEFILECPNILLQYIEKNYKEEPIYREIINELRVMIHNSINIDDIDYISGGDRRAWFFSLIMAKVFEKPHITIYKNQKCVLTTHN